MCDTRHTTQDQLALKNREKGLVLGFFILRSGHLKMFCFFSSKFVGVVYGKTLRLKTRRCFIIEINNFYFDTISNSITKPPQLKDKIRD